MMFWSSQFLKNIFSWLDGLPSGFNSMLCYSSGTAAGLPEVGQKLCPSVSASDENCSVLTWWAAGHSCCRGQLLANQL
jgi:hypothetical protein